MTGSVLERKKGTWWVGGEDKLKDVRKLRLEKRLRKLLTAKDDVGLASEWRRPDGEEDG